jgi:soluble lytic murein transglycosylase-like protein
VLDHYKISREQAEKIVKFAIKYEKPSFPKAHDLLAIIGIESSFDIYAKSSLKKDPAIGLTQIRPKIWGLKPEVLKGNIELQIKKAAEILDMYYHKLGSEEKAIHAFNVGPTALKKGNTNHGYVRKFKTELAKYNTGKKAKA